MAQEIERKYLVKSEEFKKLAEPTSYCQGYLSAAKSCTVRVRAFNNRGYLTIKGLSVGASRTEYEYEIPAKDAEEMLNNLCEKPLIQKNRYKVDYAGLTWEIDEFFGDNQGLIVAEVELFAEDQPIIYPDWVGEEVTNDPRYFNSNLIKQPYKNWKKA